MDGLSGWLTAGKKTSLTETGPRPNPPTIQVTNRRVNALENVTIPRIEAILAYINRELDELEREDFTRLKKVQSSKKTAQAAAEAAENEASEAAAKAAAKAAAEAAAAGGAKGKGKGKGRGKAAGADGGGGEGAADVTAQYDTAADADIVF